MPSRDPRRWMILGVVCLAHLTVLLDNTVLNVAVPSLTRELGATTADVQWMINAYSLVQSGLLLTAGSLADRYGRKRALLLGLGLFGLGSTAAALAGSPGELICARAGMGVGGALLMTSTLAVVVQVFEPDERPRAIGAWQAVISAGFAAGPLIGGVMLDRFWWGSVFLINIPVALIGLAAVAVMVPESKNPLGDRPDLVGAALSTLGMSAAVFAVVSGPAHGWTSGRVLLAAAVAAVALAVFARWERRAPYPMLDVSMFHDRRFTGAVCGGVLVAFGMGGSLFLLTQHLQFDLGYGPLQAGLRAAPLAVTVVTVNLLGLGAKLNTRAGTPGAVLSGMTLLSAGLAAIAVLGRDGYGGTLLGLVLIGAGVGLAAPAMATSIVNAIPTRRAGTGAGVNGTLQELGNGLGVAVLGAVLSSRFAALLPEGPAAGSSGSLPEALAAAPTRQARSQAREAFSSGLTTSQLIGAAAVFAGGLLASHLLRRAARRA